MRTWPITRLSRMSPSQLKRIGEPEAERAPRPCSYVPLRDLTQAQQYALVKWSRHPLCRQVAAILKDSTIRDTADDRKSLRIHGLATFDATSFHVLTEEGHGYAVAAATSIARTLGLHLIIDARRTGESVSLYCACGHRSSAPQFKFDATFEAEQKHLQHLSDVAAGRWRPRG